MPLGAKRPANDRSTAHRTGARGRLRRSVGFLGAVALLTVLRAAPAAAHTDIEGSEPPDASVVAVGPRTVVLTFSENLALSFVETHLERADRSTVAFADGAVQVDGRRLTVTMPPLGKDVYQLWYKVRDPIDLHITAGSVVFGVGTSPTITSTAGTGTGASPFDVALLGLERLGLLLTVGALTVGLVLIPRARLEPGEALRCAALALRVGEAAACAVIAAEVALLGIETNRIGGAPLRTFWRLLTLSGFGKRALAVIAVGVAVQQTLVLVRRLGIVGAGLRAGSRSLVAFPVVSVAALVCVVSLSGHSSVGGNVVTGVALRVAHLGALGAWIGSLFVVLLITRGRRRDATPILLRFGSVALPAAALVVASGLALSGREVRSLYAAQHTTFGRALGVKLVAVALALALGARHHRRLRAGLPVAARGLLGEGAFAVAALGLGAMLVATPPAVGVSYLPAPVETPAVRTSTIDDLLVTVSIRPNRPGRNVVSVDVVSTRRPAPGPIESVTLTVIDGAGAATTVQAAGDPTTTRIELGTIDLASPGPLEVRAEVQRERRPVAPLDVPWAVNGARVGRPTSHGIDRSLFGPLSLVAILAAALGLTAIGPSIRPASRRRVPLDH